MYLLAADAAVAKLEAVEMSKRGFLDAWARIASESPLRLLSASGCDGPGFVGVADRELLALLL